MQKKPNIILLFTDQQRADTIHRLGNEYIQTPSMDRLIDEGVAFQRAFSPSPVCVPGRCGLYYGLYPYSSGCFDNNYPMPEDRPSMMQLLAEAGYRTHGIGKMHFTPDFHAFRGFQSRERMEELDVTPEVDEYQAYLLKKGYGHIFDPHGQRSEMYYIPQLSQMPVGDHPTQWVGDRSIEFLRKHSFEKPLFMMCSFVHPHPPFAPPTPWNKIYRAADIPYPNVPKNYEDCITYVNRFQNRYKYRDNGIDKNLVRTQKAFYYSCISFIDYQIGRILDQLEKLGQLDNSVIILTSDHGEMLGDYNCFGKRTMLDAAARIPMIVRFPGAMTRGMKCTKPVSLVDILPTTLEAAGIENCPCSFDGESLFGIADRTVSRLYVYSQFQEGNEGLYMLATEDKKYIFSAPDAKEYFFDNAADPLETRNLAVENGYDPSFGALRQEIISILREHRQDKAVDESGWRCYPKLEMPADRNKGLLFQDNIFARSRESRLPEGYKVKLFDQGIAF